MAEAVTGRRVGFARWRSEVASGGNRYDDELSAAFEALGAGLRERFVTGPWPVPEEGDRRRFAELLRSERHWLVDNILASAAPDAVSAAVAEGRRVTILVHYFPSDDPALPAADRERLAASEAEAVEAASGVVTTSAWTAGEVAERYGRADAVVAVPGIARADPAPGSARSGRAPMLLWLARLTETKDPLTLVAALARVRDLDWVARVVGPDTPDPDLTAAVRQRIAEAALAERVEVLGPREDEALEPVWAGADLLVHTARSEPYGMVVGEALAHGVPSIVPRGTGAVEAQRGAGASFPPGNAAALARELRAWLSDAGLRERWRAEAAEQRTLLPSWLDTARVVASALHAPALAADVTSGPAPEPAAAAPAPPRTRRARTRPGRRG
ncbi:glycosyltransferase family 4 protein [Leucobacter sp. wl10]|uniref:glycosyltransferase family 4 protein n=1 Tax=Leucobacter sp. wl10 TaxID=2304677 RepID=UPI001F09EED9|nr:glycosyltransferase family 4 protein [Leucobacter sp. wl10]